MWQPVLGDLLENGYEGWNKILVCGGVLVREGAKYVEPGTHDGGVSVTQNSAKLLRVLAHRIVVESPEVVHCHDGFLTDEGLLVR